MLVAGKILRVCNIQFWKFYINTRITKKIRNSIFDYCADTIIIRWWYLIYNLQKDDVLVNVFLENSICKTSMSDSLNVNAVLLGTVYFPTSQIHCI